VDLARWSLPADLDAGGLAGWLYQAWYLRSDDPPLGAAQPTSPTPATADLPSALRAAHAATARFDAGWTVADLSSHGRALARKGDESRVVARSDLVPAGKPLLPPRRGDRVAVAARIDSLTAAPGFWVTATPPWADALPDVPLVRVYWRLAWWDAPLLVHHVTNIFDAAGTTYVLKVALPGPDNACRRADAAVLYLARPDDGRLAAGVAAVLPKMGDHLRGPSPRLCQPLAPGLAVADDPGPDESFGQHRCRLLAPALLDAGTDPDARAKAMADALTAAGCDPARPHLGSAGRPDYVLGPAGGTSVVRRDLSHRDVARPATKTVGPWAAEAAVALAYRLAAEAVWHNGRCTWVGMAPAADGSIVGRAVDGDLYAGTAGIGWALAQIAAVAGGDAELARTVRGAFAHAFDWAAGAGTGSFHGGPLGVAWAGVAAGQSLGDSGLVDRAARLLRGGRLAGGVTDEGPCDLLLGAAGLVLGFIAFGRALGDDELTERGATIARRLSGRAVTVGPWRAWPNDIDSSGPPLCGLGHGASGVALAIATAAHAVDEELPECVHGAIGYERAWFREDAGWPDLRAVSGRNLDAGPGSSGWCYGAAGIGMARLGLHRLAPSGLFLAEAGAAVDLGTRSAATSLAPPAASRRHDANLSVCHGVGSVVELHLVAAEATGEAEHLDHAARLLSRALAGVDGGAPPLGVSGPIACGLPGGESPGLFLGLAGVAVLLARLAWPGPVPSVGLLPLPT